MLHSAGRLVLRGGRNGRCAFLGPKVVRSGPNITRSASWHSTQSGSASTGNPNFFWKTALSFGTGSAIVTLLYVSQPNTIRFDAPRDADELGPIPGLTGAHPKIRLSTHTDPSDLEKDAALLAIEHRNGDELMSLEAPSPERLTKILRKNEEAVVVGGLSGVLRYDINQIASNCPIEDDHSEAIVPIPLEGSDKVPSEWMFWGVYDGHSGWATSAKLRQSLIPHVYFKLEEAYKQAQARGVDGPSNSAIDDAIKAGFLQLDHEIVTLSAERALASSSKITGAQVLAPAIAGSCAILSFYDTRTQLLRVACTGDCRAVLGRRDGLKWTVTQLSSDQTGANPAEIKRVQAEHPNEPAVTKNGRLLGYEPSRAFGDAVLKWSRETSNALRRRFYAKRPNDICVTPPYMTAEPVITTTKIQPEKGDFLVLASDSLWELLSNEEVVGLVGQFIDKGHLMPERATKSQTSLMGWVPRFWKRDSETMVSNVKATEVPESEKPYGNGPVRPAQWGISKRPRTTVFKDVNVATHIARNGLGGDDHDMIASLFMLAGSNTRRFRDDLTVTVVFFGYDG